MARKLSAFSSSVGATPSAPIITPAAAGPASRAPLNEVELSPTALGNCWAETISLTKACRAGLSNEVMIPCARANR